MENNHLSAHNAEVAVNIFYSETKLITSIIKSSVFTLIMIVFGFYLLNSYAYVGVFILSICLMLVLSILLQFKYLYLCKHNIPILILSDKGILYPALMKELIPWNCFTKAYLWKFSFNSKIRVIPSLDINYNYFDKYKEDPFLRLKLILNYKKGSTTIRINTQLLDKNAEYILDLIKKFMNRHHTAETEANPPSLSSPQ